MGRLPIDSGHPGCLSPAFADQAAAAANSGFDECAGMIASA
jgi:hypothetical protein